MRCGLLPFLCCGKSMIPNTQALSIVALSSSPSSSCWSCSHRHTPAAGLLEDGRCIYAEGPFTGCLLKFSLSVVDALTSLSAFSRFNSITLFIVIRLCTLLCSQQCLLAVTCTDPSNGAPNCWDCTAGFLTTCKYCEPGYMLTWYSLCDLAATDASKAASIYLGAVTLQ